MDIRNVAGSERVYGIILVVVGSLWTYACAQSLLESERRSLPAQVKLAPLSEADSAPMTIVDAGE